MRTISECVLQLVKEFDSVLRINRIKYIIGGLAARNVHEKKKIDMPCLEIFVDEADLDKVDFYMQEAAKERFSDREVESISDKGQLIAIHYVDRSTIFMDSLKMAETECPGIRLNIQALQRLSAPTSYLTWARKYRLQGGTVRMPFNLKAWCEKLFFDGKDWHYPNYSNAKFLISTTIGYQQVIDRMSQWDDHRTHMIEQAGIVDEMSERIDVRSKTIRDVMDRVRALYKE